MPTLRKRQAALRTQLDALETELHDAETFLKLADTLEGFLGRLADGLDRLSLDEQQRILRLVVREVLIGGDDKVTIRHSIPTPNSGGSPNYQLRGSSPLTVDRQRRAVRAGRTLRPRVADDNDDTAAAGEGQTSRRRDLPPGSLCGRLCRLRGGRAGARRGAERRGRAGDRAARSQALAGEDPRCVDRRGVRLLGFAIKRVRGRHGRMVIHTYPSKRSLQAVKAKVRQITHHTGPDQASDQLLQRVNRVLRGWCNYFRHGVSSATFAYLRHYAYWRVVGWLRRKHPKRNWGWLRRTYLKERWPSHNDVELFNPAAVRTERYRYRGARIPTPWEQGVIAYRDHTTAMDYLEGLIAR